MRTFTSIFKNITAPAGILMLLVLSGCSSYQYSGYETDGIYGESRPGIWEQPQEQVTEVKPNNGNSYYKDLFAQQGQMYGEILESDVFTDVDSYSSNTGYEDYNEVGGDVAYVGGNAPWGEDPDSYAVNIYNNNRFGFGFGPGWGPGWGMGWGYASFYDPFFDPFWPNPYFYGNYPYYGVASYWGGWGFGFGFNNWYRPWGWNRGYWNSPYYNRYYNRPIAYNNSRRNSRDYGYQTDRSRNYDTNMNNRRTEYSRRIRDIRNSREADGYSRRSVSASRNSERSSNGMYTRSTRRTVSPRTYESSGRSPVYNRSSNTRSNGTYRSSSSSRRSSAPSRVSSGSTSRGSVSRGSSSSRSSGSSGRSSGSSSRGRG